ncbi:MAG: SAF domain-containing protein [Angustibacter sp.]
MSTDPPLGSRAREPRPPQVRPGDRLPAPPRQRRPALAALAVLLIVGGAALAGLLAVRMDERVSVLVAARDIPVGTKLAAEDLSTALISADGVATIPSSSLDQVVGQYTNRALSKTQLVDANVVDRQGFQRSGNVSVGVPMIQGRVPAQGLQVGDAVLVLRVPKEAAASVDPKNAVLSDRALVIQTTLQSGESRLTGKSEGTSMQDGNQAATVLIPQAQAVAVARAAAAGEISLVLVERGTIKVDS